MEDENIPIKVPKKQTKPIAKDPQEQQVAQEPPSYYEKFLQNKVFLAAADVHLTYLPQNGAVILSLHDFGNVFIGAFYLSEQAQTALKEGLAWLDAEKQKQTVKS